jgi:photosystem II stability/assembly factor-like uncharacterized protein
MRTTRRRSARVWYRDALVAAAVASVIISMMTPSVARASNGVTHLTPEYVERAGTTNVVYVLWAARCHGTPCYQLERSNDGGRSFTDVVAPPIIAAPSGSGMENDLSYLDFANGEDGYAVEGIYQARTKLFATFNGGRTWHDEQIAANLRVMAFTSTSSSFYAISAKCRNVMGPCTEWRLDRTPLTSGRWTGEPLASSVVPGSVAPNLSLTVFGSTVWVASDGQVPSGPSLLATSHDGGRSYTVRPEQILDSAVVCGLIANSATSLWAVCNEGNMQGQVLYSSDAGATWTVNGHALLEHFGLGDFDPISGSAADLVNWFAPKDLYRVSDDARSVRAVGRAPRPATGVEVLVFTNARQGLALMRSGPLLRTENGGRTWRRVSGAAGL